MSHEPERRNKMSINIEKIEEDKDAQLVLHVTRTNASSAEAPPEPQAQPARCCSGRFVSWLPSGRLSYAPGVLMVGICGHSDENIMAIYIQPLPCVAIVLEWQVTKPANTKVSHGA